MPLADDALAVGIRIQAEAHSANAAQVCMWCLGGAAPYFRGGRWVTLTRADNDATKLAAIQAALA